MEYQVMPELTPEEYAELKADIALRGVMVPIEFDEHGNVLDGYHRLQICAELGIKEYPKVIRAGMTEAEKLTHARKLNMARRHLNAEQKRELIREQLKETPEQSDRQIAKALGVTHPTVGALRRELEENGDVEKFTTSTDTLGRGQPRIRKPVSIFISENADDIENPEDDIVSEEGHEDILESEEKHKPHVSYNSGNNEWYTPSEYIESARAVMGSIDLDPASSDTANETVRAEKIYTYETNGLSHSWSGNVWLNPPYSYELIVQFADKLIQELNNINQAIVLVNNATETEWFNKLIVHASCVCFPRSRVKFYMPDGRIGAPLQGQAILYFGTWTSEFIKEFQVRGWCALPQ